MSTVPRVLSPQEPHDVAVQIDRFTTGQSAGAIRQALQRAWALGANAVQCSDRRRIHTYEYDIFPLIGVRDMRYLVW